MSRGDDDKQPKPTRRPPRQRRPGWLPTSAFGLLAILVAFAGSYFVYLKRHEERLTGHYLRRLAVSGENIAEAIQWLQTNFQNAVDEPGRETRDPSPENGDALEDWFMRCSHGADGGAPSGGDARREPEPGPWAVPCLERWTSPRTALELIRLAENVTVAALEKTPEADLQPQVCAGWQGGRALLRPGASWERPWDDTSRRAGLFALAQLREEDKPQIAALRALWQRGSATVDTPLQTLAAPLLPAAEFDQLLLARRDGEVLAGVGGRTLRIDRLPAPPPRAADSKEAGAIGDGEPWSSSRVYAQAIAGETHRLFVQPLRLPIELAWMGSLAARDAGRWCRGGAETGQPEPYWLLAGIKQESGFRAEVRSLPPPVVFGAVFLVVYGLLALPYLKIRFIGVREALRKQDVFVEAVAIGLSSALFTLAAAELLVSTELSTLRDRRLGEVTTSIRSAFSDEIADLSRTLDRLSAARRTGDRETLPGSAQYERRRTRLLAKEPPPPASTDPLGDYPLLEMAIWMNEEGLQIGKWTVKETTTALISAADRLYFRRARDRDLWPQACPPATSGGNEDPASGGCLVESIRSLNTGEVRAVLSRRLDGHGEAVVAAAVASLQSVIDPVLPHGHGFAILDADGRVLFHSDRERNLREELFEELDSDARLRTAVEMRGTDEMGVRYRDRSLRLRSEPLAGTPWTLVVFADREESRLARVEALSLTLLLFLAYAAAVLMVTLGMVLFRSGRRRPPFFLWFWLDPARAATYRRAVWTLLLLAAAWAAVQRFWSPLYGPLTCGLLGLVGIASSILLLRESEEGADGRSSLRFERRALAPAGIVPAVALVAWIWGWPIGLLATVAAVLTVVVQRHLGGLLVAILGLLLLTAAGAARAGDWEIGLAAAAVLVGLPWLAFRVPPRPRTASRFTARFWYLVGAAALSVVGSVLPTLAIFRAAQDEAMLLLTRHDQQHLAMALDERSRRIAQRFRSVPLAPHYRVALQEKLFPADLEQARDLHLGGTRLTRVRPALEERPAGTGSPEARDRDERAPAPAPWLGLELGRRLPPLTPLSHALRRLGGARSADGLFEWPADAEPDNAVLLAGSPAGPPVLGAEVNPPRLAERRLGWRLATDVARLRGSQIGPGWWLAGLLGLALLWHAVHTVTRRVFLLDQPRPRQLDGGRLEVSDRWPHRLELRRRLCADAAPAQDEDVHQIDAGRLWSETAPAELAAAAGKATATRIVVDRLHEGLGEPVQAERKLELLERLVAIQGKRIVVHSEVNPWHFFHYRAADFQRGAAETPSQLERWSAILQCFERVRRPLGTAEESSPAALLKRLRLARRAAPGEPAPAALEAALEHLAEECWADPRLGEIAERLAAHPDLAALCAGAADGEIDDDGEPLVKAVLDRAENYYGVLWSLSSKDEKMVLYRICQHGVVSWKSRELVRRLIHRGLVLMTPNVRPMSRSFACFVLDAEPPEVFDAWEREAGTSLWSQIRLPLLLSAMAVMAFMFTSQPHFFERAVAVATAIAAGLPLLLRLGGALTSLPGRAADHG